MIMSVNPFTDFSLDEKTGIDYIDLNIDLDTNLNKYSSKLTENFKGIVLKTPLILNVNCAKILAKKNDFMACVTCIKKDLSIDVMQHRA